MRIRHDCTHIDCTHILRGVIGEGGEREKELSRWSLVVQNSQKKKERTDYTE